MVTIAEISKGKKIPPTKRDFRLLPRPVRHNFNEKGYIIKISEPALMHLCLGALEAYVIGRYGKPETEIFGLLWGTTRKSRKTEKTIYSIDHGVTHLSATGDNDSVDPDPRAIKLHSDLVEKIWPQYSCVGNFHLHPYSDIKEAKDIEGWLPSQDDRSYLCDPEFRRFGHRVCVIATVCKAIKPTPANKLRIASNVVRIRIDKRYIYIAGFVFYWKDNLFQMSPDDGSDVTLSIPFIDGYSGGH